MFVEQCFAGLAKGWCIRFELDKVDKGRFHSDVASMTVQVVGAMDKGRFHSDLVGMTVQVVWCIGQGWIFLGFRWHDCVKAFSSYSCLDLIQPPQ